MLSFSIILAVDEKNGIGKNNELAWKVKEDMKFFKELTTYNKDLSLLNAVIMGKNTWESLPKKYKPLPDRINCILSSKLDSESLNSKKDDFVLYFKSFKHCLKELFNKDNVGKVFVIGGATLYNAVLDNKYLDKIYITKLKGDYNCDTFFAGIPDDFELEAETKEKEENGIKFTFEIWRRR